MTSIMYELETDRNTLLVSEILVNRLYFVTFKGKTHKMIPEVHFFSSDDEFKYNNFYKDFGPLNILAVYKFNQKLRFKLNSAPLLSKRIVQFTTSNPQKRVNAAFLMATYCLIYLKMKPREIYDRLSSIRHPFLSFQDASNREGLYTIRLFDCINAFSKAIKYGFLDFNDFDSTICEKMETTIGGDMSWIIPQKMLAFSSPVDDPPDRTYHSPKFYVDAFYKNKINTVVRLNCKTYDSKQFTDKGIDHYDLIFPDGGTPPSDVLERFLEISEFKNSVVAVHCKAGLGRTGCLIGAYLMKHYRLSSLEAIAWMRICRPGCVIGCQQSWLEDMEPLMWSLGDSHRNRLFGESQAIHIHQNGIYSKQSNPSSEGDNAYARLSRPSSLFNSYSKDIRRHSSNRLNGEPSLTKWQDARPKSRPCSGKDTCPKSRPCSGKENVARNRPCSGKGIGPGF